MLFKSEVHISKPFYHSTCLISGIKKTLLEFRSLKISAFQKISNVNHENKMTCWRHEAYGIVEQLTEVLICVMIHCLSHH